MKNPIQIRSKRFKGGGGGTQTVESIPEWARPYIEKVAQEAGSLYDSGQLDNVASTSVLQQSAFNTAGSLDEQARAGSATLQDQQARMLELAQTGNADAVYDTAAYEAAKGRAGINNEFGASGTLGSAREAVRKGSLDAELASKAQQQILQNKLQGEQALGSSVAGEQSLTTNAATAQATLGAQERDIAQQQADAPWQALQRYASTVYGNPARQQAVSSGGGK